jgi:hypothetical protein
MDRVPNSPIARVVAAKRWAAPERLIGFSWTGAEKHSHHTTYPRARSFAKSLAVLPKK